jgi:micrococcal nuclease
MNIPSALNNKGYQEVDKLENPLKELFIPALVLRPSSGLIFNMRISWLVFLLMLLSILTFAQQEIAGKVISIADGDTFTMLVQGNKQVKIRLHGIDCPEKGQDYGEAAKKYLSSLISLHHDSVKVIWKNKDRYRRKIGIAYSGKTNINEVLLQNGLAWHYTQYDKNPQWSQMEAAARNAKLNLWSRSKPVPPWEWRKK